MKPLPEVHQATSPRTRVDICVPVYNGDRYLEACLQAIAVQTFEAFNVIIVDNASTDRTAEICAAFSDPRFFYTRNPVNIGANRNHSRCLDLARSGYVKLLSADDVLWPETLALQVAALDAHPEVGLATCDCVVTGPDLAPLSTTHYLEGRRAGRAVVAECVGRIANLIGGPSNTLLRMSAVGSNRFDVGYTWLADLELHCRILGRSDYINIDRPGFFYRRHDATDSSIGCPADVRDRDDAAFVKQYATNVLPFLRLQYRRTRRALTKRG